MSLAEHVTPAPETAPPAAPVTAVPAAPVTVPPAQAATVPSPSPAPEQPSMADLARAAFGSARVDVVAAGAEFVARRDWHETGNLLNGSAADRLAWKRAEHVRGKEPVWAAAYDTTIRRLFYGVGSETPGSAAATCRAAWEAAIGRQGPTPQ